jgi:hypothetical protein
MANRDRTGTMDSDTGTDGSTSAWIASATRWADAQMARARITRTGEPARHRVRPWGTVVAIPTDAGTVWLKAVGPTARHEVAIAPILAAISPEDVLTPIAADPDRGWLLLPNGGAPPLGDDADADAIIGALLPVMPRYAALQLALAPLVDDLLDAGVPDMRPARLPAVYRELLVGIRPWLDAHGTAAQRAAWPRLAQLDPWMEDACARLAASPVPASLDHQDLHDGNVLVADGSAPPRLYDWGDSVIAHPFASALVPMGMLIDGEDLAPDDSRLLALRDAYLEPFTALAPHAELVVDLEVAARLAHIARAWTWSRVAALAADDPTATPDQRASWEAAPFRFLSGLLLPGPFAMLGI